MQSGNPSVATGNAAAPSGAVASATAPSLARLIGEGLRYHWRIQLAVALGVIAGTAVLTGALVVGDSVRGSLRHLALDRLGRIDEALVADQFFRAELVGELAAEPDFLARYEPPVPAILLAGSVFAPDRGLRASNVTIMGVGAAFWQLEPSPRQIDELGEDEIILNRPLADDLRVAPGQEVLLRMPTPHDVPPDSPLGKKTESITSRRLTVRQIVPAGGLGGFTLRPNQQNPRNAFVSPAMLQRALTQPDKINAMLIAGRTGAALSAAGHDRLQQLLRPRLEDYGLLLVETDRGYFNLSSQRMILDRATERAALASYGQLDAQPVFTYLANSIATGGKEIPYSTVASLDFAAAPPLGPFVSTDGQTLAPLADGQIALAAWAAEDLGAAVGDTIRLDYFEPESTHGEVRQASVELKLAAVVALQAAAADRRLTPELPGVTDQLTIAQWNPPFPFDSRRIRPKDEEYWKLHQATPKAFVSLATGRKLWASRFGQTTSLRISPPKGATPQSLAARFSPDAAALGLAFQPVKRRGLDAAAGTTPFNVLFLAFSFFIIVAAVMLVALLFRLGVDGRARQVGLLLAVGWTSRRVGRLLLGEGAVVALVGGLVGAAAGIGYAWLMLAGLRSWWVDAITTPFLALYVTPASLVAGCAIGILVSLGAIAAALRQMRRASVRGLLSGRVDQAPLPSGRRTRLDRVAVGLCLGGAVAASLAAMRLAGEAQAGAFFASAALVLVALLTFIRARLVRGQTGPLVTTAGAALSRLAIRNAARHPARSTLTIGLVAAASFLIVAVSAFRLAPPDTYQRRESGTGGFALLAESDQPLYQNLNSDEGRYDLAFSDEENQLLGRAEIFSLRLQAGDDASCKNLYQTAQPRILGLPTGFIERGGFAWAGSLAETDEQRANPWLLLEQPPSTDDQGQRAIPVVIDQATAVYSLHLGKVGDSYEITAGPAAGLRFRVVGLLKNSILQGSLLISERQFLDHFPATSGYRYFLVDAQPGDLDAIEQALESTLADHGLAAEHTTARLADFLAVQNTYLSTFQSLGGLGLLLGTFGLAVVQLRNVIERRGELALLRATGFRRSTLARMVLLENAALLVGGLLTGTLAALLAVLPHLGDGGAGIPWLALGGTFALILVVGLAAGTLAVRAVLETPVLAALRAE